MGTWIPSSKCPDYSSEMLKTSPQSGFQWQGQGRGTEVPSRALGCAGASSQEQPSFSVTPVAAAGTAWCHQEQFESSLWGSVQRKRTGAHAEGERCRTVTSCRVETSPMCLLGRCFSLSLWRSFQLQPWLETKLMLECLSVTPGATSCPCPGETEAMSKAVATRGAPCY